MKVNPLKCPQNHPCPAVRVCPAKAISQKGNGLPEIDSAKCLNCQECVYFCPMGAISI